MKLFVALVTIIVLVIAAVTYCVLFTLKIKYILDEKNKKKH